MPYRSYNLFCPTCPGVYPLPEPGPPTRIFFCGEVEPAPEDRQGAVEMHQGHDYRLLPGGRFRYCYSQGGGCWVQLQYGTPEPFVCGSCGSSSPAEGRFCPMCGVPR